MGNKRDLERVAAVIISEGLGYAVMDYLSPEDIADAKLAALWADAQKALHAIMDHLDSKLGDSWNDES